MDIGNKCCAVKIRQKTAQVEASHHTMVAEETSVDIQLGYARDSLETLQTQEHDLEIESQYMKIQSEEMMQTISELKKRTEEYKQ
jgi:hypothetical protein